jgi:hypothetical protein
MKSLQCVSQKLAECDNDKILAMRSFLKSVRVIVSNESCVDDITDVINKARVEPECNIEAAQQCADNFANLPTDDADTRCL